MITDKSCNQGRRVSRAAHHIVLDFRKIGTLVFSISQSLESVEKEIRFTLVFVINFRARFSVFDSLSFFEDFLLVPSHEKLNLGVRLSWTESGRKLVCQVQGYHIHLTLDWSDSHQPQSKNDIQSLRSSHPIISAELSTEAWLLHYHTVLCTPENPF